MFVVIADGLTALRRAPESNSRRSRSSTVFIGRLSGGLGTPSLLRRRRLALHLFLDILRRRCDVSSCTIHRAGRRMLINFSAGSRRLSSITRSGSGTCILCARGLANGVARAGPRGGSTQNQDSAACEKQSFRVHLLLLGSRRWNEGAPSADPAQTRNGPVRRKFRAGKAQSRYSSIKQFLFASQP
jgi:hypothetical protein